MHTTMEVTMGHNHDIIINYAQLDQIICSTCHKSFMPSAPWEQVFFWQFIIRAIIAATAAIHGHMTSKMGVATKGHMYLLFH